MLPLAISQHSLYHSIVYYSETQQRLLRIDTSCRQDFTPDEGSLSDTKSCKQATSNCQSLVLPTVVPAQHHRLPDAMALYSLPVLLPGRLQQPPMSALLLPCLFVLSFLTKLSNAAAAALYVLRAYLYVTSSIAVCVLLHIHCASWAAE